MRRPVDQSAMRAAGYFVELGIEAGAQAQFHLSTVDLNVRTRLLRLDRAAEPESTAWPVTQIGGAPAVQNLDLGSWLLIRPSERLLNLALWTLELEFRLTASPAGRTLIACGGMAVRFADAGALVLEDADIATGQILPIGTWLHAQLCSREGNLSLAVSDGRQRLVGLSVASPGRVPAAIRLGADLAGQVPTLNAGIGHITLRDATGQVAAAWRFPPVGRPHQLAPVEGAGVLEIHNAPTFGLRSPRWDGNGLDPRLQPEHYDAVALHDDDLADAAWPETHRVAIPASADSGVYAIEVASGTGTTRWPFLVTAKQRRADLVFLVPTFTYLAYANERLPPERFPWLCDDVSHRFAKANELTSLYDTHNDGSGVSLASFRRPLAT